MKIRFHTRTAQIALCSVAILGGLLTDVRAQDGAIALDEITAEGQGGLAQGGATGDQGFAPNSAITGAKTDTPINEIPQIVNVITREELDKRGAEDFNQALAYTPAVRVTDYPGGQGGPTIYIRGFQSINSEGLYQDGLRAGFNGYDKKFDVFPYERIDILKGPASVLYGRGQPGGIVSLTTKRPTTTPFGEVELQGGSFDRKQGTIDVGGPIDEEGKYLYRISGLIRDSDTQVRFTPDNRRYIAPSFTWRPTDDTSVTLLGSYTWSRAGGSEQSLPISGTIAPNSNGKIPRNLFLGDPRFNREELEGGQIGGVVDHKFSEVVSFHSTTRAEWTRSQYDTMLSSVGGALFDPSPIAGCNTAVGGVIDPLEFDDGVAGNERCYTQFAQKRRQNARSFQTDNNFVFRADTGPLSHKIVAGVDFQDYRRNENRWNGNDSGIDVFNPDYGNADISTPFQAFDLVAKIRQTGLYARDQIKLDRWILTLGLRHDWAETSINNFDNAPLSGSFTSKDKKFSYQAALGYEFENGVTPYVSYSTAFNPQPVAQRDSTAFKPTTSEQYEAGVKYQPKGYDGYVAAALFEITQKNLNVPDINNIGYFVQTGAARVRGFEVESKVKLTTGLSLLAAYTYLDTEIIKDEALVFNGVVIRPSKEGNRLQNVPKHQASLWLDYAIQPGSTLEGLRFGGGVRYMGGTMDANNVLKVRDYTLFDASASYDLGKANPKMQGFTVKLEAQNLGDKRYYTPGFYPNAVFAGFRRQVLASVSYRW